ncbi:uncharacterized protein LOC113038532 [Carassius auratus]|uniref:Uncharacterized protein LOC113038532 n=1 Tax=Carassius auratus TaxID=7957 RepID=A0A6P6IZI9_CARAU|nr:uncharacterized protein LOC113038532 [Carassius auratus]
MARQKLSVEDQRRRNREYQRKRREKLNSDQESKHALQEKERQRWKKRVKDKKVIQIDEMGDRAKRNQRKYWREAQKRSREKRSIEDAVLRAHTPPDSPQDQDIQEYNARHSRQSLRQKRERSKTRKRHSREIKTLKEKLKKVTKQRNKLRKKIYRRRNATNKTPLDSPGTETKKMLSESNIRNPKIKKVLLFHNILRRELKKNKQTPGPRRQEPALSVSSGKILKKYCLLHQIHQFGITYKLIRGKKQTKKKPTFLKGITETVKDFFLNSARVTTDKTDTITRNKIKQQRMILADSMINLHSDFLISNPTVKLSYSSFCSLKPFYITAPKASDRKTCLCQKHENAYLILEVLRMSGVVKSNNLDDSFQLVCCSPASEACLLCTCSRCVNKGTVTTQEQDKIHVQWKQWERVQEETVNGINTKLVQHSGSLSKLIKLYEQILRNETTTHVCLVRNQSKAYRNTIETCEESTAIVHVDFSEFWRCKYQSEVQACHFGQNLPQLTLHTGMYYIKGGKAGFCTLSESKRQDAAAIWTHMDPVLKDIKTRYPQVTTVHFWSDGPSKQYKNKKNFFLLSCIPPTLGFERATWNFFPTSHGKGTPDGIGGTVKRTADNLFLRGNDVTDGHTFFVKVSNSLKSIQLYHIAEEDMQRYDTLLMHPLKQVPSTRKIHQVIPHENRIQHRQLSCFCLLVCQCFSPATFYFHGYPEEQQSDTRRAGKKRPLAMLLEEMEKEMVGGEDVMEEELDEEPLKSPEGTVTVTTVSSLNNGDWLAVVYDDHWWLAKTIAVDTEHQDLKVEFLHPHGPTAKYQPKLLTKDVCFCPVKDIIVKLMGIASPVKLRKREIYSIAPDVMDFIEREHVRRLLPKA